jgi:DnaK suppressor protein
MPSPPLSKDAVAIRDGLITERTTTLRRIAAVSTDIEEVIAATTSVSVDDEHDPEGSTIAFERSQLEALREQGHRHLAELDAALHRLDAGRYGRCERCGHPIATERLGARPSAITCIRCA